MTAPIRIRRRWHPSEDHTHGPNPLPWRWTCDNPACPHTRLEANAASRDVAQFQADAHLYVAAVHAPDARRTPCRVDHLAPRAGA